MTSSSRLACPSPSLANASPFVLTTPITLQYLTQFALHKEQLPTLVLADGSVYCGDLQSNAPVPHGIGIMLFRSNVALYQSNVVRRTRTVPALDTSSFSSGDRYGGSWVNGCFDGDGILITSTYTYQGSWSEGKPHGKGCMTYSKHYVDRMPGSGGFFDGALSALVMRSLSYISPFEDSGRKPREYMGDFHKVHLRHGTGMMKYYNGDVYEGEWVSNRRHGQGKLLRANGEVYTGQWVADERHGTGRIVYANGTIFKGTMVHDHRHGSGTMNFANGDEYVGNFNNDVIEGQGMMRYKNGDVYEGAWKDNTRHGLGKYTLKRNAVSVEGNFVHGLVHGDGTVNHPGLSTFVGRFDRGERTRGTIFWHDGPGRRGRRCYQGEWAGETMQGKGLMWFTNGDFYSGQFVKNRRTGLGNMRYADGAEYSGQFVQDQRHGWGLLQAEDGSIEAGRWSHDRFVEGYEGEWDGRALNGVGHLKLAVRTLLEADTVARASNTITTTTSVMNSNEESAMQARTTATANAHVDTARTSGEDDNEELVDFFGIFVDGRRDGMGVLKLPALLGLPQAAHSGSANKGMHSSSGGKKKNQSNKGRQKLHSVRRHVIKGCWRDDVLHCDRAVWAFPSGEVYIGGFVDGLRQGALGRLWLLDGSVFVGPWWQNAACGAGVYFAKNRRDPIYRRLASPPSKKSDAAAADEVTMKATEQSSSTSAQGGTRFGLDALWRVFMAGPGSTRSHRRHNRGRRGTRANTSSDDNDEEDNTTSSEGGGGGARLLQRRGRLLMGYRDHYYTTGTWCPVELSIAQYTTYIAPQIATQTPCLPAHLAPIKSWVNTATTTNINNTNGSIGLANNAIGMSGTLQDTGAIATPTSTPRLALRSQDVSSETSGQPRIEVKSKPPPFLLVGAKSREGMTCYPSGLRVQMRWHGNYPALVSPYRPCSFYDVYLQWVKTTEDNLQSLPSLLGRSTTPCPSAQCVFTVKQLRPHAVADGWGPSATRRQLYSTSNHHSINESTDDSKNTGEEQSVSTAATQCSFCGRLYGFFRKATQCTICLRSSCSSCLGGLEVDARPDVTALLRSSQALLQRIQTANTEEKNNTETISEQETEGTKDETQDLLQDRTLLVSSGQSLPVCGDCMRAVLQELRLATLSIPLSFFRSILSPTQTEQTEVIHDLPLTAAPVRTVTDEQNTTRDEGAMRAGEVVAALPFDLRVNEPTVSFVEPERCPAPSEEYMTPDENTNNSSGEAAADVIRALPEVIHNDTAPLSPLSPRGDRTPEFSRASRTLLSTPPTSSMLPEMMMTNAAVEGVNTGETAATAAEDTHTPPSTNEDAIPDVPLTRNLTTNNALEKDMNVIYSGYTSHNVPHLWGRMWWGTRQYYEGGFQLGARHGYGTQYMSNGERYVGLFRNDEWDGPGCYFAEDGSALQGIFDHGTLRTVCYHGEVDAAMQRHGRGIAYEADGSTYNGEWQHGIRSGTGLMQAADGTLYAGQFRAGCAEGQGKLVTRHSAYYGSFRAGKKHGAGLEFYAECAVQGQWERGLQHGFCRIFDATSEEVYETTYRHGNERDDCFAPPIMVDDADCATCARCGAGFGLFLRRHHCRLCGEVFCDACSQHRATLPAHFFTTNAAANIHIGTADDEDNSDSLASTQQQQQQLLVTTPQRICDECFQRLEQRRMLALRRYADGAVYAGCWSQGRWVSRGLYCRPDGVCIVMNAHGKPLLPAHSTLDATNTEISSTAENSTGAVLVDGSPTRAALDALPSGSSMRDVDAFVIWWASTSTRCRCRVLLDVPLLQRYYADQSQQQQTQHTTHQVESETNEDGTRSGRETSVERMSYPSIPDTPAPRLFVAAVNHDATNTKDVTTSSSSDNASVSVVSIDRDAAEAASLRAARFVPAIIPAPPVIDLNIEPMLTCTSNKQCTSNNDNGKEGENLSVMVPPALEEYDLSDETMVRAIQEERQRRFRVASTTPKAEKGEENKETEGEQKNNDESNDEMKAGSILLRSRGHCPPLLPPTPAAPAEKSNDTIAWEAWATHPLPAICGCHFGPTPPHPVSTAQKEPGNNTPQETHLLQQQQQGEDNNAQRSTAAPLTSRTDKLTLMRSGAAPEEVLYYSCPLWCPVVPPVEEVLEQGKLQQAALLQQRYAQAVCEGKSNAHTPRNVQEEEDEKDKKNENVMRGVGEKWLPAPLRGPFRFSIAVKDNGSASSERFIISQVCNEE